MGLITIIEEVKTVSLKSEVIQVCHGNKFIARRITVATSSGI
jgi:hypothetical protein